MYPLPERHWRVALIEAHPAGLARRAAAQPRTVSRRDGRRRDRALWRAARGGVAQAAECGAFKHHVIADGGVGSSAAAAVVFPAGIEVAVGG